jgi:hypothetical protein
LERLERERERAADHEDHGDGHAAVLEEQQA